MTAQALPLDGVEDALMACLVELLTHVAHVVFSQGGGAPGTQSVRITQEGAPSSVHTAAQVRALSTWGAACH